MVVSRWTLYYAPCWQSSALLPTQRHCIILEFRKELKSHSTTFHSFFFPFRHRRIKMPVSTILPYFPFIYVSKWSRGHRQKRQRASSQAVPNKLLLRFPSQSRLSDTKSVLFMWIGCVILNCQTFYWLFLHNLPMEFRRKFSDYVNTKSIQILFSSALLRFKINFLKEV